MAICYKYASSRVGGLCRNSYPSNARWAKNPRGTKAFAIQNQAGKWSITSVHMGNNFEHTLPREFGR